MITTHILGFSSVLYSLGESHSLDRVRPRWWFKAARRSVFQLLWVGWMGPWRTDESSLKIFKTYLHSNISSPPVTVEEKQAVSFLWKVKPWKALGPDELKDSTLKACGAQLECTLTARFQQLLGSRFVLLAWKKTIIVPHCMKNHAKDVKMWLQFSGTFICVEKMPECLDFLTACCGGGGQICSHYSLPVRQHMVYGLTLLYKNKKWLVFCHHLSAFTTYNNLYILFESWLYVCMVVSGILLGFILCPKLLRNSDQNIRCWPSGGT